MVSSALLLLSLFVPGQIPDAFPTAVLQRAHRDVSPAVCLVLYSSEVTNPNTGETSKRDNSAPGLIVSPSGLVMTPGHMQLENAEPFNISVSVLLNEKEQRYDAKLLKKPDDVNVCFLQIESETPVTFPCVHFARGGRLELGEPLMLIGIMPESLDFARGVLTCRIGTILDKPRTTYCIDSTIRFGFVGGPVVNAQGRVVGVIGFDLTPAEGGDLYIRSGHPLVYQADLFAKYIDTPPAETVTRTGGGEGDAWMGVFTQPLTDDLAEYWHLPNEGGIIVSTIVPGTPADTAGFKPGDVIVAFNGIPLHAKQDRDVAGFTKLIRDTGVGKTVPVKSLRNGQPWETEVTLSARPKAARDADEFKDDVLGLTVREMTTDVRIVLNLSENVKGVIVRRIKSGGVAEQAGLRPGVIVMNLGNYPVTTLDEYQQAIEKIAAQRPKQVTAFCRAGTETGFFRLEPRWEEVKKKDK